MSHFSNCSSKTYSLYKYFHGPPWAPPCSLWPQVPLLLPIGHVWWAASGRVSSDSWDSEGFPEFTLLHDLFPVSWGYTYFLTSEEQTMAEMISGHVLYYLITGLWLLSLSLSLLEELGVENSLLSDGCTGESLQKSLLPRTASLLACYVLPNITSCPHPDSNGHWATFSLASSPPYPNYFGGTFLCFSLPLHLTWPMSWHFSLPLLLTSYSYR